MFCWQCGEKVGEGVDLCPSCGQALSRLAEESLAVEPPEQEVHSLLAQANLLRLRKDWSGAAQRCTEALRAAPGSASAHSLLGDVCRDEGRLRDAMEWYKLALSLDPLRRADREKLDALIDRVYGAPAEAGAEGAPDATHRPRARLSPAVIASAVFAAALITAILVVFFRNWPPSPSAGSEPPFPSESQVVVPAIPALPPAQTAPPATAPPESQPAPPRASTSPPPTASADLGGRQQQLAEKLSAVAKGDLGAGVVLLGVQIDPRRQELLISFSLPQEQTLEAVRRRLLEVALRLAREAAVDSEGVNLITVRGNVQVATTKGILHEPAFIGEARAAGLREIEAQGLSETQASRLFSNVWWHPVLANLPAPPPEANSQ